MQHGDQMLRRKVVTPQYKQRKQDVYPQKPACADGNRLAAHFCGVKFKIEAAWLFISHSKLLVKENKRIYFIGLGDFYYIC